MKHNTSHIKYNTSVFFSNYEYKLYNTYIYNWESDFFAISKSGYTVEAEIKISRSDFKADYKKLINYNENKHKYLISDGINKPNKFYFICPEGLIKPEEINERYGLIYIRNYNRIIIKNAKFLHKNKILEQRYFLKKLLNKFYLRNIDLRICMDLRDIDLKHGQKRLDKYDY